MKIFISWSGEQSKTIALALNGWLQSVIQSADPYMSDRGNVAGDRWGDVVNKQLHESNFGILCMTPDNLDARWLLFEAGALGKAIGSSHVVPLLHGVSPSDVEAPLTQFMMKATTKAGVRDVIDSINKAMKLPLPDNVLNQTFEAMWPVLEDQLSAVSVPTRQASLRSDRDLLEELLALVRAQSFDSGELGGYFHGGGYSPGYTLEEEGVIIARADALLSRSFPDGHFQVLRRGNTLYVRLLAELPRGKLRNALEAHAESVGLRLQIDVVGDGADG